MTGERRDLVTSGDIVERQSYLNGTRYYLVEGACEFDGAAWTWTFSVTLPKQNSEAIREGDLSLVAGERSWFADVVGGTHAEMIDDALDTPIVSVKLALARRNDSESTEPWPAATATLSLAVDACEFALLLED